MRYHIRAVFMLLLLACASSEAAEESKVLTGDEWARMFQSEQLEFVSVAIKAYADHGISIQKPAPYYVYSLNTTIAGNSLYETASVADVLDELFYKNEPALRSPEAPPSAKIQKIEMH